MGNINPVLVLALNFPWVIAGFVGFLKFCQMLRMPVSAMHLQVKFANVGMFALHLFSVVKNRNWFVPDSMWMLSRWGWSYFPFTVLHLGKPIHRV